jgi:colanic acid/amylovoran biosynthesis glycosyltransferase
MLLVTGGFPLRSETFIRDHVMGLIEAGVDLSVLALHAGDGSTWEPDEHRLGVPNRTVHAGIDAPLAQRIIKLPARWAAHALRSPTVACRLCSPSRGWRGPSGVLMAAASALGSRGCPHAFDRIHAEFGPSGVVASKLRRAGCISGPLSCAFYGYDATRAIMHSGPGLYDELFEDADLLLPNSEFLGLTLKAAGAPGHKVMVHRLGVVTSRFRPSDNRSSAPSPWRATAIGRFVPKKGLSTLLHAMALAGPAAPKLTLVGDGPLGPDLRALSVSLGIADRVHFAGWLSRTAVLAELGATDALIAPSETAEDGDIEGMPVVVMEAMACGLPIIGTRHSGIPEIVRDGVNGLVVPERDPRALAAAIERMSDPGLRLAFGRQSRVIARVELDHETLMHRLVTLLCGKSVG